MLLLRRNSLQPIAQAGKQGCRVIAVDRPPFGLSQRPLSWNEADGNPYTATVRSQARAAHACMMQRLCLPVCICTAYVHSDEPFPGHQSCYRVLPGVLNVTYKVMMGYSCRL